jgi:tetratricopeptide (TPR) repeat protein
MAQTDDLKAIIAASLAAMNEGEPDRALIGFEKALEVEPDNAQVLFFTGCALSECGDYQGAIAAYEKSAKNAGEMAGLPLYNLGNAYDRIGDHANALKSYQAATQADPTMADAWINMGRLLADHGSHEAALECYEVALQIDAGDPVTWSNRGNSFRALGALDKAEESYLQALQLDENDVAARLGLGCCLAHAGSEQGLGMIAEVCEMTGNPTALFEQATALAVLDRFDEALVAFDELVRSGMTEAPLWNNRGECLAKVDRISDALDSFDQAIEIDADYSAAYFGKARLLVNAERIAEAKRFVERYLELATDEEKMSPAVQALCDLCDIQA